VRNLVNKRLIPVKISVKAKFALERATKFQNCSKAIFLKLGARCGWMVNALPRPH